MSIIKLGTKTYLLGKSSKTGMYTTWELKRGKWALDFTTGDFTLFKSRIKRLRDLAQQRETRAMIADMCGTSYSAAMVDMGLRGNR